MKAFVKGSSRVSMRASKRLPDSEPSRSLTDLASTMPMPEGSLDMSHVGLSLFRIWA